MVLERYSDVTYLIAEGPTKQKVIHFDLMKPYRGERHPVWMRKTLSEYQREQQRIAEEGRGKPQTGALTDGGDHPPDSDSDGWSDE